MYLCGIADNAICYGGEPVDNKEFNVHGFVESDQGGDIDHKQSTSRYVFKTFSGEIN